MSSDDDRRPGLHPPRFGLAALMGVVTMLAGFFGLLNHAGSHLTALLLLLVLAVIAHVAGNALGTRLRENGDQSPRPRQRRASKASQSDFAPATRLGQRYGLGRAILIITAAGGLLGGVGGGYAILTLAERPVAVASIVFGGLAAAVLGGIWTFVAASFLQVASSALWQATRDANARR